MWRSLFSSPHNTKGELKTNNKKTRNIDITKKNEIINEISTEFDLKQLKTNLFECICEILTDIDAKNKDYKKAQLGALYLMSVYPTERKIINKTLEKINARYPKSTKEKIVDNLYAAKEFGDETIDLIKYSLEDKIDTIKRNIDEFEISREEIIFGVSIIMAGLSFTQAAYLRDVNNRPVDKSLIPNAIVSLDEFETEENYKIVAVSEDSNMPLKKEFNPGEHVLLKEVKSYSDIDSLQIDGYQIVGTIITEDKSKVAVVYSNTEKVECTKTEDGYNNFGKVVNNKKLVLKQ